MNSSTSESTRAIMSSPMEGAFSSTGSMIGSRKSSRKTPLRSGGGSKKDLRGGRGGATPLKAFGSAASGLMSMFDRPEGGAGVEYYTSDENYTSDDYGQSTLSRGRGDDASSPIADVRYFGLENMAAVIFGEEEGDEDSEEASVVDHHFVARTIKLT